jgi:hypothetical protein
MAKEKVRQVEETEREAGESCARRPPPRTAAGCRAYMRSELTRSFPAIVEGFVKVAEEGSCPHVKLATELLQSGKPAKPKRSKATRELLKRMAEI